jgi:hypothetical protein
MTAQKTYLNYAKKQTGKFAKLKKRKKYETNYQIQNQKRQRS